MAACNYVIGQNGCSVNANGNYTVLTLSDAELSWSKAISVGQSTARRAWSVGNALAAVTYEGVNEEGLHIFYCHAV